MTEQNAGSPETDQFQRMLNLAQRMAAHIRANPKDTKARDDLKQLAGMMRAQNEAASGAEMSDLVNQQDEGPVLTAIQNAGNAASFGAGNLINKLIPGNSEVVGTSNSRNPGSAIVGSIAGSAASFIPAAGAGAAALTARTGLSAAKAAFAARGVVGAAQGAALAPEGYRGTGALTGGILSAVGPVVVGRLGSKAARILKVLRRGLPAAEEAAAPAAEAAAAPIAEAMAPAAPVDPRIEMARRAMQKLNIPDDKIEQAIQAQFGPPPVAPEAPVAPPVQPAPPVQSAPPVQPAPIVTPPPVPAPIPGPQAAADAAQVLVKSRPVAQRVVTESVKNVKKFTPQQIATNIQMMLKMGYGLKQISIELAKGGINPEEITAAFEHIPAAAVRGIP